MSRTVHIVVDIGGTRIKLGLISEGQLIIDEVIDARPETSFANTLERIASCSEDLMKRIGSDFLLDGIGIAFPGLVDVHEKRIISTNKKYDDAVEIDLDNWIQNRFGVPFFIDNDARMALVGEWKYGAGQKSDDLVLITLGTGIGTAAICQGSLLRGRHFQAGCLGGHFTLVNNGRRCTCGNLGCAEAEASFSSLKERLIDDPRYLKSTLSKLELLDYTALFIEADRGDELACSETEKSLDIWGSTAVNLIHAYDPDTLIIGGGIAQFNQDIKSQIEKRVKLHAWTPWGQIEVKQAELDHTAALFGLSHCLSHPC